MNCWHCDKELIWGGDFDYSDYKSAHSYYEKQMEKQWGNIGMKIANMSFKHSPVKYDKIDEESQSSTNTPINWRQRKYQADTGVLTLYNPDKIEYIGGLRAENWGADNKHYEFQQILPKSVIKIKDSLSKKCSFKKSWYCETKKKKGAGSPYTFDKFNIKSKLSFSIINIHLKMNFPRVDSLKTVLDRIEKFSKESKIYPDFSWKRTVLCGDLNASEEMARKSIKQHIKFTKMKHIFTRSKADDRIYFGKDIQIIKKKQHKNKLLKFKVNKNRKKIRHNNKLIKSDNFMSDHPPYIIHFRIGCKIQKRTHKINRMT